MPNRQSATSNTTRPSLCSTVPDDHTLPHPLSRTFPCALASVWYSHTGLPVCTLAATYRQWVEALKSMFEAVSAKIDQVPDETAKKRAHAEERLTLSTFFSVAEKAVQRDR